MTFSGVMAIQHVTRGETVFPPPFLSSDVCVSVWISMVATEKTSKPWEPSPYYIERDSECIGAAGHEAHLYTGCARLVYTARARPPRAARGAHTIGTGPEHPAIGAESPDSTALASWSNALSLAMTRYARFFCSISVQSLAPRPLPSIEGT